MHHLTTAELRGYQQICQANGTILVIACDQRGSMRKLLAASGGDEKSISDATLGDTKSDVTRYLASHAPCILLDPLCALPRVIAEGALARDVALLIGLDASGYDLAPTGHYVSRLVPGISARRVRELGGTGGKLLVYLRPDQPGASTGNIELIRKCIADFAAEDLLLVVEFLTYPMPGEDPADYRSRFPLLVSEGCRICLDCGSKVLKIPFPGTAEACSAVSNIAGEVPWSVLSAGVDHATFLGQVEIAMANGAAGVIAGRSLWKDCVSLDRTRQQELLRSKAVPRLREIQAILDRYPRRPAHLP
ncbi:MAG: tagatose-bisphosphate aldolase [Rhizobiales bacterium]|nr:tagatose-bisphosphate aldolase [Hyphomicrobiales bacterium]MBI3671969.1 tagatose-bisphosphate aldolase [Hyphomicrobiales bacterium]